MLPGLFSEDWLPEEEPSGVGELPPEEGEPELPEGELWPLTPGPLVLSLSWDSWLPRGLGSDPPPPTGAALGSFWEFPLPEEELRWAMVRAASMTAMVLFQR